MSETSRRPEPLGPVEEPELLAPREIAERYRAADRTGTAQEAAQARIGSKARWVEEQIRVAMARGDFDDLPGAGKPIPNLGESNDPHWWVKRLLEREQITGVLPEALQLRKDDAVLEADLDRLGTEKEVREAVAVFNRRVVTARRQLQGGPPVVTPTRDVDAEVAAWAQRRRARREALRAEAAREARTGADRPRRRWWGSRAR
ncbi:DUF1992 domain-containing protein [Nocardioides sp.]|uniref:DnaJ family domain-containing protein n=1 Tax=Nocardioides sp. TaxID=35761 RepID=UPI0035197E31